MKYSISKIIFIAVLIVISSIAVFAFYEFSLEEENKYDVGTNLSRPIQENHHIDKNEHASTIKMVSQEELVVKLDDYFDIKEKPEYTPEKKTIESHQKQLSLIQTALEQFNKETDSITAIDNLIIALLEDKSIAREEKVYGLWELANYFDIDSGKGGYLLDYLGVMKPIELTDSFLDTFQSNISNERKVQFLHIMGASVWVDNENQTPEQIQFIQEKREQIQALFKQQIESSDSPLLFREALLMYPSIVPAEEAIPVLSKLMAEGNNAILPEEMMALSAQVAFANDETQLQFLPSLLDSLQSPDFSSTTTHESFNEHLYGILLHEEASQFVHQDVKANISQYLQKQKPNLSIENKNISIYDANAYYDWVQAYAFTTSADDSEKSRFIAEAVMNTDDPIHQASILMFSEQTVFEHLQNDGNLDTVKTSLNTSLEKESLSPEQKDIIKSSLSDIEKFSY